VSPIETFDDEEALISIVSFVALYEISLLLTIFLILSVAETMLALKVMPNNNAISIKTALTFNTLPHK
jgi:hypothetical protein